MFVFRSQPFPLILNGKQRNIYQCCDNRQGMGAEPTPKRRVHQLYLRQCPTQHRHNAQYPYLCVVLTVSTSWRWNIVTCLSPSACRNHSPLSNSTARSTPAAAAVPAAVAAQHGACGSKRSSCESTFVLSGEQPRLCGKYGLYVVTEYADLRRCNWTVSSSRKFSAVSFLIFMSLVRFCINPLCHGWLG